MKQLLLDAHGEAAQQRGVHHEEAGNPCGRAVTGRQDFDDLMSFVQP